jgi:uncharacterized membrane protein (UPF0127 family)
VICGRPLFPRDVPQLRVENGALLAQASRMKFPKLSVLALTGLVALAGCSKDETTAPPPVAVADPGEPTHAQPKLATIKLWLGAEQLDAEMALTFDQERTGMMFRTNLTDSDAMIFVLPVPQRASFWMKNCPESLSAAYIDPDGVIQEIRHLEQNDTNSVVAASDNVQFVLEVKDGWFARHNIAAGTTIRTEHGTLAQTFLANQAK